MKKFFRYLALIATVLVTAGALATIAFTRALVNGDIYIRALAQSGLYNQVTEVAATKVTAYLVRTQKELVADLAANLNPQSPAGTKLEPMAVWFLDSLIDQKTGTVVAEVVKKGQFEDNIQKGTEQLITYLTGWLAGTQADPRFFAYIPEPEQIEAVRSQGVAAYAVGQLKQEVGIADLPPCTSNDQVGQNLKLLAAGKTEEISCYSPQLREAANKSAKVVVPKLAQTQLAVTIENYLEKYQVKKLANDLFDGFLNISQFKQDVYNLRSALTEARMWAQRALWGSLVLLTVGLWLTEKRRLKTLFLTYLWVGVVLMVGAFTYTLTATRAVEAAIPETPLRITDPAISLEQKQKLAASIEAVGVMVVKDFASSTWFMGIALTLIAGLALLTIHLVTKSREKHQPAKPQAVGLFDETEADKAESKSAKTTKTKSNKKKNQSKK